MDPKITLVRGLPEQDRTVYHLIYWYPVESPISGVAPTPAATLPEEIVRETKLPAGYAEALNAGEVAFELAKLTGPLGEPESAYVARFFADYNRRYTAFHSAYEEKRNAKRAVAPIATPTTAHTPTRTCEVCNGLLDGYRANARVCSNACRQKAHRQRKKAA